MRGFTAVKGASAEIEARKNSGGSGGKLYFKVADGDTATVRFLEQGGEVQAAWVHELPKAPGRKVGDKIPCRSYDDDGNFTGDDCPGCERQLKRTFQGVINVIWRNAPVYARDEQNKLIKENGVYVVVGQADQNAVWISGITVFDELSEKDSKYKGLSSRDFDVKRKGTEFNTRYSIEPHDPDGGPQKMSAADEKIAEEKYDLSFYTERPSYETWGKTTTSSVGGNRPQVNIDASPFARRTQED